MTANRRAGFSAKERNWSRRTLCRYAGAFSLSSVRIRAGGHAMADPGSNLLSAPLELGGDWVGSLPSSVLAVLKHARQACLTGVALLSDRQPDRLHIDDHSSGPPSIWLHFDNSSIGWIIVDVGERDWSRLSYQFGHELGHVLCTAGTRPPSPNRRRNGSRRRWSKPFRSAAWAGWPPAGRLPSPFAGLVNAFRGGGPPIPEERFIDGYAKAVDHQVL